MTDILLAAGILCLLYFIILLMKSVDFCIIWLPVGMLFLAAGCYWKYTAAHPDGFRIPGAVLSAAGVLAAILMICFAAAEFRIIRNMFGKPEPGMEYIIVLGAQVKGENPSRALLRRLEAAETYLEENPETKAVLSGGQGPGENISEAQCMYRYLTETGIEKERLIIEDRSTTTRENLQFSAEKIAQDQTAKSAVRTKADGNQENSVSGMDRRTGILSNNFHVYRALCLAGHMGYTQCSGVAARSDWRLQLHYMVREFFALIKEKSAGNI